MNKNDLENQLTDEQRKQRTESRQRLEHEVAEMKVREEAGEKIPNPGAQERAAERLANDNILDIGEAMKPVLSRLEQLAKDTTEFCERIRKEVEVYDLERCEFHDMVKLVDMERTYYESRVNQSLTVVYRGCPYCIKETQDSLVNESGRRMGIPNKVAHATFNNFQTDGDESKEKALMKARWQFNVGRGFLILRGKWGTGKSHLAVAILKCYFDGLFVTEGDLVGELRQTYTDNSSQQKIVDKYRNTPVLVIDELSLEIKGVDIPAFLYRILAYRYDQDLLTILTSNESLQTILDILGPRLADRIRPSYSVATMEWNSYRKKESP